MSENEGNVSPSRSHLRVEFLKTAELEDFDLTKEEFQTNREESFIQVEDEKVSKKELEMSVDDDRENEEPTDDSQYKDEKESLEPKEENYFQDQQDTSSADKEGSFKDENAQQTDLQITSEPKEGSNETPQPDEEKKDPELNTETDLDRERRKGSQAEITTLTEVDSENYLSGKSENKEVTSSAEDLSKTIESIAATKLQSNEVKEESQHLSEILPKQEEIETFVEMETESEKAQDSTELTENEKVSNQQIGLQQEVCGLDVEDENADVSIEKEQEHFQTTSPKEKSQEAIDNSTDNQNETCKADLETYKETFQPQEDDVQIQVQSSQSISEDFEDQKSPRKEMQSVEEEELESLLDNEMTEEDKTGHITKPQLSDQNELSIPRKDSLLAEKSESESSAELQNLSPDEKSTISLEQFHTKEEERKRSLESVDSQHDQTRTGDIVDNLSFKPIEQRQIQSEKVSEESGTETESPEKEMENESYFDQKDSLFNPEMVYEQSAESESVQSSPKPEVISPLESLKEKAEDVESTTSSSNQESVIHYHSENDENSERRISLVPEIQDFDNKPQAEGDFSPINECKENAENTSLPENILLGVQDYNEAESGKQESSITSELLPNVSICDLIAESDDAENKAHEKQFIDLDSSDEENLQKIERISTSENDLHEAPSDDHQISLDQDKAFIKIETHELDESNTKSEVQNQDFDEMQEDSAADSNIEGENDKTLICLPGGDHLHKQISQNKEALSHSMFKNEFENSDLTLASPTEIVGSTTTILEKDMGASNDQSVQPQEDSRMKTHENLVTNEELSNKQLPSSVKEPERKSELENDDLLPICDDNILEEDTNRKLSVANQDFGRDETDFSTKHESTENTLPKTETHHPSEIQKGNQMIPTLHNVEKNNQKMPSTSSTSPIVKSDYEIQKDSLEDNHETKEAEKDSDGSSNIFEEVNKNEKMTSCQESDSSVNLLMNTKTNDSDFQEEIPTDVDYYKTQQTSARTQKQTLEGREDIETVSLVHSKDHELRPEESLTDKLLEKYTSPENELSEQIQPTASGLQSYLHEYQVLGKQVSPKI